MNGLSLSQVSHYIMLFSEIHPLSSFCLTMVFSSKWNQVLPYSFLPSLLLLLSSIHWFVFSFEGTHFSFVHGFFFFFECPFYDSTLFLIIQIKSILSSCLVQYLRICPPLAGKGMCKRSASIPQYTVSFGKTNRFSANSYVLSLWNRVLSRRKIHLNYYYLLL